jgi:inhibitor of KinA sporulation pathway (predicted exonuclease)
MNYIMIDLEWNAGTKKHHFPEIIEIAAVKVKEVDGLIVIGDSFHSYVRPIFQISKRTKQLTQVKIPDTWLAKRFPYVHQNFIKWIGKEDFVLCSWGPDDQRVFIRNCELHKLGTNWLKKHVDFQKIYSNFLGLPKGQQIGLVKALEREGLTFEGIHHSAKDDARNTAILFVKVYQQLSLRGNLFDKDEKTNRRGFVKSLLTG